MCRGTQRSYRILRRGRKWKEFAPDVPEVKMPPVPTGGAIDALRIQSEMIWFICVSLADERFLQYADGTKMGLEGLFKVFQLVTCQMGCTCVKLARHR